MRPVGSKYVLDEPLGRGATGTVWRGHQRETAGEEAAVAGSPGEAVAIKVLKEELAQDPDVVMRFLRERSVLLRLSEDGHGNIVRTRDMVVEGELLALVMDLVDGPDLHRYLHENGPFSPMGAALVTAQIADALSAAHARGVVHRDLKPANVLLAGATDLATGAPTLRPMLTDFGIARLADAPGVTRTHEFVGSPSYVAPESAEGREQSSAVDVYGAGVLLYELVTGEPPFRGGTALEVLQRHLTDQPRRPDGLPDPLWTVIDRCLRKRPDERPSAGALARGLRAVAAGIVPDATPEQQVAALGVGALLTPDPSPVKVPGTGVSAAGTDATQVIPGGSSDAGGVDPHAATSVLPPSAGARADGGLDATRAMPAQEQPPAAAPGPHPWESQLRAARDRNEQTQIQPVDPAEDPLSRTPRRRAQRPAPQPPPERRPQRRDAASGLGYGEPYGQGYGYPQSPGRPRPAGEYGPPGGGYPAPGAPAQPYPPQPPYQQPPQYQPQPPPQPQRSQPQRPQPQRAPRRSAPEPPPREPRTPRRSANPMRIPGLGCLKGCLVMVVILVVACWLVWNFTPVQDWIAEGKSFWQAVQDGFDSLREMLGFAEEASQQVNDIQGG